MIDNARKKIRELEEKFSRGNIVEIQTEDSPAEIGKLIARYGVIDLRDNNIFVVETREGNYELKFGFSANRSELQIVVFNRMFQSKIRELDPKNSSEYFYKISFRHTQELETLARIYALVDALHRDEINGETL